MARNKRNLSNIGFYDTESSSMPPVELVSNKNETELQINDSVDLNQKTEQKNESLKNNKQTAQINITGLNKSETEEINDSVHLNKITDQENNSLKDNNQIDQINGPGLSTHNSEEVHDSSILIHQTEQINVSTDKNIEVEQSNNFLSYYHEEIEKRKPLVEETHTRDTYLIRNDVLARFNKLAKKEKKGFKMRFINYVLEKELDLIEKQRKGGE